MVEPLSTMLLPVKGPTPVELTVCMQPTVTTCSRPLARISRQPELAPVANAIFSSIFDFSFFILCFVSSLPYQLVSLKMAWLSISSTVGVLLCICFAYAVHALYSHRSKINELRKQGVVSRSNPLVEYP